MKTALLLALPVMWLLLPTGPVAAHEARPLVITIDEMQPGQYRTELRVPQSVTPDNRPELRWPDDCVATPTLVRCNSPQAGMELTIAWPLFNPAITTLLRYTPYGGATRTVVLGPQLRQWRLPEAPGAWSVARQYLGLGIHHILLGIDHLLFVLGLLLIAREPRRILLAITGFTIAHSVTLSAAVLGVLRVPVPPTEAAIALSIVFLAREALRAQRDSLAWRYPAVVSLVFGLLHGLGFASALGEVGLPDGEVVVALLFFNIGVEVGQIAFILAVAALVTVGLRLPGLRETAGAALRFRLSQVAAWCIGLPASYWLLERVLAMHVLPLTRG
jgi:hydrogenase/urease accessory protein HupE